jgi:hypothetical protein
MAAPVSWALRPTHEYDGEVHRDRQMHRSDLARDRRLIEIDCNEWASPRPSSSTKVPRSSQAPTGCWDGPGIRNAWRAGRLS